MKVRSLRHWAPYLIVLLILAVAAFLVGNVLTERSPVSAQAAPPARTSLDPNAPDGGGTCTIENIAAYEGRIHVRCQPGVGGIPAGIPYFAMAVTSPADSRMANRYLALLMTAWAFGKHPYVNWYDSATLNPPGCATGDCRRLGYVILQ